MIIEVHALVNWVNPYDHREFPCFIDAVHGEARTVDVSFEDGSQRGSIPFDQLVQFDPKRRSRRQSGDALHPRGIDSDEHMGRF